MNKKEENDSCEAPICKPKYIASEEFINEYLTICPECSSLIEILSINEDNNIIEYRCLKEDKIYIKSIRDYLEKIKENKQKNINELKDICKNHENQKYVSYCFDCKCHLCEECLKKRNHINHRKNNIIEIKPM